MKLTDLTIPGLLARYNREKFDVEVKEDDTGRVESFFEKWAILVIILIVLNLAFFVWGLIALVRNTPRLQKEKKTWAVVLGWIFLFVFPPITILIAYLA